MDIVFREISNTPPITFAYIFFSVLVSLAVFPPCSYISIRRLYCINFRMLEETWYNDKPAEFLMMFFFCISLTSLIAIFVNMLFLSHVLTMMLVYVWSRRNPFVRLNIFGILEINAPYLPWVFFAFSFLMGNNLSVDLIGIIVGHLYYFLEDVYPYQANGFRVIRAPHFLKLLLDRAHNRAHDPIPEAQRPGGFDWNRGDYM